MENTLVARTACAGFGSATFLLQNFAHSPTGQPLKYNVLSLPKHGRLCEISSIESGPLRREESITAESIPYGQREFNTPRIKYVHDPASPTGLEKTDEFVAEFCDGNGCTTVVIYVDIILYNRVPVPV